MFRHLSGKFDAKHLATMASDNMNPVVTASGALMVGALLARAPLRWLLAFAGGFVIGQAMRDGPWRFADTGVRRPATPEWISKPKPGPDGHLSDDALVHHASEDSFPASDPPSYTTGRGS
jgi:hypothetical protein